MSTSLIIVAPALLHREAWRSLLGGQPEIAVTGAVDDVSRLTPLLTPGQATTLLLDLPAIEPGAVRDLVAGAPGCTLLFLVQDYDVDAIVSLLRAGATGVISRHESVGELARAVIAAGRGEIVLPPAIASSVLGALARGERTTGDLVEALSDREQEVLGLLARGLTNKDIAQALILSVRTVEAHLRSVYGKLGVRSRTEAVLWAVRHGHGERR